ncbi:MAG: hypothetical protein IPK26_23330 [Planctomycetes bacterium]|nr:hypothetical protein [Planctomycetota bacterium]
MTTKPPPPPPWTVPIAVGALTTALLHGAVLWEPSLWLPVLGACGCSASPIGLLPAGLALRRDPKMGPAAGFAVAFIAVGLGAIALTAITLLHGFEITPETERAWRESLQGANYKTEDIERLIGALHDSGGALPVLAATLLALAGGISGAALAGLAVRRSRRALAPPSAPPAAP